ncbi:MAG: hypothetical protein V8T86_13050 [Victivallis sp.]
MRCRSSSSSAAASRVNLRNPGPDSTAAIRGVLIGPFKPQTMMNRMTMSAERVLILQSLFRDEKAKPRLIEAKSYPHARELMLLRLSVAEEDTAEAEKLWPAAVPRRRISAAKREDSEASRAAAVAAARGKRKRNRRRHRGMGRSSEDSPAAAAAGGLLHAGSRESVLKVPGTGKPVAYGGRFSNAKGHDSRHLPAEGARDARRLGRDGREPRLSETCRRRVVPARLPCGGGQSEEVELQYDHLSGAPDERCVLPVEAESVVALDDRG